MTELLRRPIFPAPEQPSAARSAAGPLAPRGPNSPRSIRAALCAGLVGLLLLAAAPNAHAERQFGGAFESEDYFQGCASEVLTGDWNRDGLTDFALVCGGQIQVWLAPSDPSLPCASTVWINPPVLYPPGRTVLVVDADGDGNLDIVSVLQAGGLQVNAGVGDGSFGPGVPIGQATAFQSVVGARLVGSEEPSLLALSRDMDSLVVFPRSHGQIEHTGIVSHLLRKGHTLASADIDRDGDGDAVVEWVLDDAIVSLAILHGDGSGHFSFSPSDEYPITNTWPWDVQAVDLDGDGAPEVVSRRGEESGWQIRWNDGHGHLDQHEEFANPNAIHEFSLVIGNLADGARKSIVTGSGGLQGDIIEVFHVLGHGSVGAPLRHYIRNEAIPDRREITRVLGLADFDADETPDVLASWEHSSSYSPASSLVLLKGMSGGRLGAIALNQPPEASTLLGIVTLPYPPLGGVLQRNGNQLQLGVLQGDRLAWKAFANLEGTPVAAISTPTGGLTLIAENTGTETRLRRVEHGALTAPVATFPASVVLCSGDADGDGRTDLLMQGADGSIAIALDDGLGAYRLGPWLALDSELGAATAAIGPIGGAEHPGIALFRGRTGAPSGSDPIRMDRYNLGAGSALEFLGSQTLPMEPNSLYPWAFAAKLLDLNGDHLGDLLLTESASDYGDVLTLMWGPGDSLQHAVTVPHGYGRWYSPEVADWDADGDPDIAIPGEIQGSQATLLIATNPGDGSFATDQMNLAEGTYSGPTAIGDLDGDGRLDLAMTVQFWYSDIATYYVAILYGRHHDSPTAVQLSLAESRAEPGLVHLAWQSAGAGSNTAELLRRDNDQAWEPRASLTPDGTGRFEFDDRLVTAGTHYAYKLRVHTSSGDVETSAVELTVPELRLALATVFPNPADAAITVRFSLASTQPARLELFDLGGRRVRGESLTALSAGSHDVRWQLRGSVAPGIYWLALTQAGKRTMTRIAVVR